MDINNFDFGKHKIRKTDNREKDIDYTLNVINRVINENNNFSSKEYSLENCIEFKSKSFTSNPMYEKICEIMIKLAHLYEFLVENSFHGNNNDSWMIKDYKYMDKKQIHCIFISLLAKGLIYKHTDIKCDFYQGFYKFKNNPFAAMCFGEYALGFHAWLAIDGCILDSTFINQQRTSCTCSFSLPAIIGDYPSEIEFIGINENDIIDKYMTEILKSNGLTYDKWIDGYNKILSL